VVRNTRDRLIEAAGDLFYRTGFQAVGLDQILQAVGITKTAFYKHFESKDDLILAVLERRDREDIANAIKFMRQQGGPDPRGQILALFDLLAQWFAQPDFRGCFFMNAATEFASPNDRFTGRRRRTASTWPARSGCARRRRRGGPGRLDPAIDAGRQWRIAARHAGGVVDAATTGRRTAEALLALAERADAAAV